MLHIDPLSRIPVYEQVITQFSRLIVTGVLKPQEAVPSVRGLATSLGINPNTILKAYGELAARGIFCAVPGKGYFVASDARQAIAGTEEKRLSELYSLAEQIALAGIPEQTLLAAVRDACAAAAKKKE